MNLTSSKHYSAIYLRVLHLNAIKVDSLSNDLSQWSELEYIYVTKAHWNEWPENIAELNKISFFHLWDMYTNDLPPNICEMSNLRAINIYQSPLITASANQLDRIPNCMTNLEKLESIIIYLSAIKYFPLSLLSHQNIQEIAFIVTNITFISFIANDENDGSYAYNINITDTNYKEMLENDTEFYESWTFDWNRKNQTSYYFQGSYLCKNTYHMEYYPKSLELFVNETGACNEVCSTNAAQVLCSPLEHQNGVCDTKCNIGTFICEYEVFLFFVFGKVLIDCFFVLNFDYTHEKRNARMMQAIATNYV